ncbi:MAG: serine hydrolase domain-containing protein [Actinomycetota bacterium]
MTDIQGTVNEGYGAVADAFAQNFEDANELGAGFCLHVNGENVVDIWAGVADKASGRAWDDETLQLVFSTTKGAAAICIARLVQDGKLGYDDKVADHWPEFAQNGKGDITVSQVMSHQAGIPAVDAQLTFDDLMAVGPVVEALAAQAPMWEPGAGHGYHAVTYGWLAGELLRRIDGRTMGTYFDEEIAGPLGLDFWIGLPEEHEHRVSTLAPSPPPSDPETLQLMLKVAGPGTLGFRALFMDGLLMALDPAQNPFNTRAVHATEMPAANGITNARSLSRMYAATIGEVDGVRILQPDTVDAMRAEQVLAPDKSLVVETRFGHGMMLHHELSEMIADGAYGHAGAGGSLGYAHPESGVAYGYVMNQMGGDIAGDPRTRRLNAAIRSCLS